MLSKYITYEMRMRMKTMTTERTLPMTYNNSNNCSYRESEKKGENNVQQVLLRANKSLFYF